VRVLFSTTGHSGHLLPLVPLARACVAAGHDVVVVTHAPRAPNVERLGLPVHAVAVSPDEAWAPLMAKIPRLRQSEGDALIIREGFARIGAGGALPGVLAVVEELDPDVVVHEGYEFAAPIAAEVHDRPLARMALGLASTEEWVVALAAAAVADLRRSAGLAPEGPRAPLLSLLPPSFDDGPATQRFRAGALAADAPAGDGPPLVYVTLGSVTGSLPFYPELHRRLLEALADVPARVLLTLGRDADPAALGPVPANARVEAWVDQDEVLGRAAAVVSHGGHGTTLGALAHGVPQAILPLFAGDQWRTARRVGELGAGVVLEDGERGVFAPPGDAVLSALPAAVSRLVDDPAFADAARALQADFARMAPADAAVPMLEGHASTAARSAGSRRRRSSA
jgi:UDP:flavonoid glycosyltransferase YjiC (YdhE family)